MIVAEELLEPISEEAPCGEDLSYDASFQELETLAKLKAPLVKVRGQWVQLTAEEIQTALDFWKNKTTGQATVRDLVQMALGGVKAPGGIAFAGSRRISAVELSWDNGRAWHAAELHAEFAPNAWRFWQLSTSVPAGHYTVSVRARDGEGTVQTSKTSGTLPNGADGYHSITLDLA